jgi:hypothetical protein
MNTNLNNKDEQKVNTLENTKMIDDVKTEVNTKANNEIAVTVESKKNTKPNTTTNTEGRFTTKHFEIDNEIPCPICGTWQNAKNFNRHAERHNTDRKEIYTNKKYQDKIKAMYENRKAL